MAVKKKVDREAQAFIDRGADVKSSKDIKFKNLLIRVPTKLLIQLDAIVSKKPWLTRTQWIVTAIDEKLNSDLND